MTTSTTGSGSRPQAVPLTERYVWAVARRLPESMRDDVARELRGTIADMTEARGGRPDDESVVRPVLVELGDPVLLSREYAGTPRHLIGPHLYDDYVRLLKALALVVLPVVLTVVALVNVGVDGDGLGWALLSAAGFTAQVAVHLAFWSTLLFAILERTDAEPRVVLEGEGRGAWDPDRLPETVVPRQIGVADLFWGVGMTLFLAVWLPWQHFRSPYQDDDGDPVPLLDPDLWSGWLPVLVLLALAVAVFEVRAYAVGYWTRGLVVTNLVLNALTAAYFVALHLLTDPVNPAYSNAMAAEGVSWDPAGVVPSVVVGVLVVVTWDSIDCVLKHRRLVAREA
jgi:hypothetical protein